MKCIECEHVQPVSYLCYLIFLNRRLRVAIIVGFVFQSTSAPSVYCLTPMGLRSKTSIVTVADFVAREEEKTSLTVISVAHAF